MAFYCPDGALQHQLDRVIDQLAAAGRPELHQQLSVTWLRYARPLRQRGASASDAAGFWAEPVRGASVV